jgi:hypothetical protein
MASILDVNLDILSTSITVEKVEGGKELVLDFQFSPEEMNATLQDLFA